MTDTPKRKTLGLNKQVSKDKPSGPAGTPRKQRSGARARQAALHEHAQNKRGMAKASAGPHEQREAPHRSDAQPRPPGRTRQPQPDRVDEGHPRPARHGETRRGTSPKSDARRSAQMEDARPRIERRDRTPRPPRLPEQFRVFAPCPSGLEEALWHELTQLGMQQVERGRAGCHFSTDWLGVLRANLYSRLATRILVQLAHAPIHSEDDILALALETEWERWFGPEQTLRVDTSAIHSSVRSLQYCNLRVKDGICDRLRQREGARPSIDTVRPDARAHLFLDADSATLYLDVTGESLFKRGWRLSKGEAPLRENLAAGLLALSDWTPAAPLLDPFCGSGTILIEAAWIALGVPPGIWRPFGFERLRSHDARLWRHLKEEARSHIATRLDAPLVGCDRDGAALESARANLERAHLTPDAIRLETADARRIMPPADSGWIVTNPPYGERLPDDEQALWPEWAAHLKQHYDGWRLNVISSDLDLPKRLRLKARRRQPVHNGALDCRLFQFELVANSYRKRADPDAGVADGTG